MQGTRQGIRRPQGRLTHLTSRVSNLNVRRDDVCGDDSADQLSCDTLDSPQEYRLAICGDGDASRCDRLWHYVPAASGSKGDNHVWSVVTIDPKTGHAAEARQEGAMRVWAYRGRPVYTYAGDKQPGDYTGHGLGEWQGRRNGYRAFWIRSELFSRS